MHYISLILNYFILSVIGTTVEENESIEEMHFIEQLARGDEYWCPPCFCGVSPDTRVIGGKPNEVGENPWMVALVTRKSIFFCGGTLIADIYVLTAAHCIKGLRTWDVEVVFSEKNHVEIDEEMADRRQVVKIIMHAEYNKPRRWSNDIALLKLNFPAPSFSTVVPACLPPPNYKLNGKTGYIAGWGKTSETGTSSSELLVASVPILSNTECQGFPGYKNITASMMCAGHYHGGVDACQGDSGGPLLVLSEYNRFVVAGIVSWGIGCARPMQPGVYTRVNHFIPWIIDNTRDACYCY